MEKLSQTPSKGIKSNYGDTVINHSNTRILEYSNTRVLEDYIHDNNEMFDASQNSTQDQNNVTLDEDHIIKASKIIHNVHKIFTLKAKNFAA